MANNVPFRVAEFGAIALLVGCVSVHNKSGLTPPLALCSHIRATVGVPDKPVTVAKLKNGKIDGAVHIKEWVFSGVSAGLLDMMMAEAAKNGGLKKIYYADYEQTSYLGFVTIFDLVAYGE